MDFDMIYSNDAVDFKAKVRAWLKENAIAPGDAGFHYTFEVVVMPDGVRFVMTMFYVPLQEL